MRFLISRGYVKILLFLAGCALVGLVYLVLLTFPAEQLPSR